MWALGVELRAIRARYGRRRRKTSLAIGGRTLRWERDRSESIFLRLLERLPDTARYRSDGYGVYGYLPVEQA